MLCRRSASVRPDFIGAEHSHVDFYIIKLPNPLILGFVQSVGGREHLCPFKNSVAVKRLILGGFAFNSHGPDTMAIFTLHMYRALPLAIAFTSWIMLGGITFALTLRANHG